MASIIECHMQESSGMRERMKGDWVYHSKLGLVRYVNFMMCRQTADTCLFCLPAAINACSFEISFSP